MKTAEGNAEGSRGDAPNARPSFKEILSADLPASFVVFLVAVPLCMGIAVASGAPVMSGLIAGMVGGLVVGLFGGAPLLVSGPAAGLTVMVFGFIQELGFAVTCAAVVAAGVIQMAMGRFKVARAALSISPAVIHGMLAGIGILIVLGQVHVVLGATPQSNAWTNLGALPAHLAVVSGPALALGIVTLAVLFGWQLLPNGPLKKLPGPLVAVVGATGLAMLWGADVARVEVSGSLLSAMQPPQLPGGAAWGSFVVAALSLAVVASAESLLSAVATDKLHTRERANLDKELFAQGLANATSGLIGGLPVTGVIVRSSANIAAGARTRASAVMHGVWILVFLTFLMGLVGLVPLAVLAGLLLYVGGKLVNPAHIRELKVRGELPIYVITVAGVVGINLLAGIALGLAAAIIRLLWRLGELDVRTQESKGVHRVRLGGALTFVGVPTLSSALVNIPKGADVELDVAVDTLDHAGFEALLSWTQNHENGGGKVRSEPLDELWRRRGTFARRVLQPVPSPTPMASEGAR